MRLCACFGIEAHIIEPAGFPTTDRAFRRAGMDYLDAVAHRAPPFVAGFRRLAQRRAIIASCCSRPRRRALLSRLPLRGRRHPAVRPRIGRRAGGGPCSRRRPPANSDARRLALAQCRASPPPWRPAKRCGRPEGCRSRRDCESRLSCTNSALPHIDMAGTIAPGHDDFGRAWSEPDRNTQRARPRLVRDAARQIVAAFEATGGRASRRRAACRPRPRPFRAHALEPHRSHRRARRRRRHGDDEGPRVREGRRPRLDRVRRVRPRVPQGDSRRRRRSAFLRHRHFADRPHAEPARAGGAHEHPLRRHHQIVVRRRRRSHAGARPPAHARTIPTRSPSTPP